MRNMFLQNMFSISAASWVCAFSGEKYRKVAAMPNNEQ